MYVSCPSKKIDPVAFSDDGVLDSYDRRHVHMMSALRGEEVPKLPNFADLHVLIGCVKCGQEGAWS